MKLRRRRRDRGFSLVVVFLLVAVMVGVGGAVMLSTQEDLAVAGQDREALTAFYAAEYAVAQAKDFLVGWTTQNMPTLSNFSSVGWSPLLQQMYPSGLVQGCKTGPANATPRMPYLDYTATPTTPPTSPFTLGPGNVMWRYCIHNNSDDIVYTATPLPAPCAGLTGDTCDSADPVHYITIEAWGAFPVDPASGTPLPGAAITHLAVNVSNPTQRIPIGLSGYSQEGGNAQHNANGDGTTVDTTVTRQTQR